MHANRLLRGEARAQKLVLYDLLARLYQGGWRVGNKAPRYSRQAEHQARATHMQVPSSSAAPIESGGVRVWPCQSTGMVIDRLRLPCVILQGAPLFKIQPAASRVLTPSLDESNAVKIARAHGPASPPAVPGLVQLASTLQPLSP